MRNILTIVAAILLMLCSSVTIAQRDAYFQQHTPEAEGISSETILDFVTTLEQKIDAVHSFMILRHGNLVSQGWWNPYDSETPHIMNSVSKSFTSTAIGFAVQEGLISLDDLVISFFPDKITDKPSWQWKEMRIRDLLTMNTGHIEEPRPGNKQEDWVKYFLSSKVDYLPGTHFQYNSMATYMLSAIIQKKSGEKLVDFLYSRLFQPLHINKPVWDTCPKGINFGGWGLHIVTEDIAKLGQLYLQKGKWEGRQLLSEKWIAMATSKQVSNGSNPDNDWSQGYGFQFWQCRHNCYRGDGAMGQFCIVMPQYDAVIAITSGTNDMGGIMQIVWDKLLPAFKDAALPANPQAFSLLQHTTAALELKPVEGTLADISGKIYNRKFTLDTNNAGAKAIEFSRNKGITELTLYTDHGTENLKIGFNEYIKGKLMNNLPYTNPMLQDEAACGAWITPQHYRVRVYLTGSPERITYDFTFSGEELKWESNLEHALIRPDKLEVLTGKQALF